MWPSGVISEGSLQCRYDLNAWNMSAWMHPSNGTLGVIINTSPKSLLHPNQLWNLTCVLFPHGYEHAFMHGYLPWPSVYWRHLKADGRNHQDCLSAQSTLSRYLKCVFPIQLPFNKTHTLHVIFYVWTKKTLCRFYFCIVFFEEPSVTRYILCSEWIKWFKVFHDKMLFVQKNSPTAFCTQNSKQNRFFYA